MNYVIVCVCDKHKVQSYFMCSLSKLPLIKKKQIPCLKIAKR